LKHPDLHHVRAMQDVVIWPRQDAGLCSHG
jgi:hypothetical protein